MYDSIIIVPLVDERRSIIRIEKALDIYLDKTLKGENCLILTSGSEYRRRSLKRFVDGYAMKGINIFPEPNSKTIEEKAFSAYSIVKDLNLRNKEVCVVTGSSDLPTTKSIFEEAFEDYSLKFYQVPDAEG